MEDKVIKVNSNLYEKAKQIAEARGIKIGDAIVEAGQELAPSVSICEEEGFKQELVKMGITPPTETKWLFGFLDNFTPEMLAASKLAPYAEARAKSKSVCSLLPGAEEVIATPKSETTPEAETIPEAETTPPAEASEGEAAEPAEQVETEPAEVLPITEPEEVIG